MSLERGEGMLCVLVLLFLYSIPFSYDLPVSDTRPGRATIPISVPAWIFLSWAPDS
jgi:hypothetical protein